ncbi:MAG TPA: RNA polymerase sigma factor [Bryobacteraceae bacterium]|nr:RNA polymerase sigma factor [Bryobacteraceae bacterium]
MLSPDAQDIAGDALLERAKSGSPEAFGELMDRYGGQVYRLALRLTGDLQAAEDVAQETFLQVFRKLSTYRGEAQFSTWLYRVATNAARMYQRSQGRHETESLEPYLPRFLDDGRHVRIDVDYSAAARVEQLVEQRELRALIQGAVARLPELYREAFVLYDLQGMPAAEVGAILGIDAAALRQRVHRARLMMRGYLGHIAGCEKR